MVCCTQSRKKRWPFTLLEVVIALALAAMLVGSLLSHLSHLLHARKSLIKPREAIYSLISFRLQMEQLFESLATSSELHTIRQTETQSWDTAHPILCFTLHHADPLGEQTQYQLSYNREEGIILQKTTPSGEISKELLSSYPLSSPTFSNSSWLELYDADTRRWVTDWDQSTLPSMIRIAYENQTCYFLLPSVRAHPLTINMAGIL